MSFLYMAICVVCLGFGICSRGPDKDFFLLASMLHGIASVIVGKLNTLKS